MLPSALRTRVQQEGSRAPLPPCCVSFPRFHCTKPVGDPLGSCTLPPKLTQKCTHIFRSPKKITSSDYKHESVKRNTHLSTLLCLTLLRFCHSKESAGIVEKTYSCRMVSYTCLQGGQGRKRRGTCLSLGSHCIDLATIRIMHR